MNEAAAVVKVEPPKPPPVRAPESVPAPAAASTEGSFTFFHITLLKLFDSSLYF